MSDAVGALAFISLLALFFLFGLIGYLRGKRVHSCCEQQISEKLEPNSGLHGETEESTKTGTLHEI